MRFVSAVSLVVLTSVCVAGPAAGESLLERAKRKIKDKAGEKTEQAIDKAADAKPTSKKTSETPAAASSESAGGSGAAGSVSAAEANQLKPGQGAWANYDFKPGERVLYADDFMQDEVGDFPRRLEFDSGTMEIVEWEKSRWLRLTTTSKFFVPFPEPLPERYTLEFDFAVPRGEMWIYPNHEDPNPSYLIFADGGVGGVAGEGPQARSQANEDLREKVVRARVMADGKYLKLYVNEKRVANIPNFDPARTNKLQFYVDATEEEPALFGNFRVAAGGKKLYDAIAEKGRVATQGIYFDTGSDRVRPESSPTLKEIAAMLTEHPELKLVIEGHTDNVGAAAANQALSEKRAASVRQALIDGYGVAGDRLTTKGLGATKPVAPNDTPEGRQNNRRVELVKG